MSRVAEASLLLQGKVRTKQELDRVRVTIRSVNVEKLKTMLTEKDV